jgi:hypothetical protein
MTSISKRWLFGGGRKRRGAVDSNICVMLGFSQQEMDWLVDIEKSCTTSNY